MIMKQHKKHVLSCYIELFYTKHSISPVILIVFQHIKKPIYASNGYKTIFQMK